MDTANRGGGIDTDLLLLFGIGNATGDSIQR